jgi:sugar/nucleoside kinase (ribokinase family)
MTADARDGDPLDLLVIGGLTIDRFANGDLAPGGSVMHATRAAVRAGLRTAVVTTAGGEPTARDGIEELRRLVGSLEIQPSAETIRFRHRETSVGRRLWLEEADGTIEISDGAADRLPIRSILFAPVAFEVDARVLHAWGERHLTRGAILQGWLRRADPGGEVSPIPPELLADDLVAALRTLDVLVASREDLLAADAEPVGQLRALRARAGDGPMLIVTDGPEGLWIDDGPAPPRHRAAPWRVEGVPMVGAGDALAALFVAGLSRLPVRRGAEVDAIADDAMRRVAEMLEARRR